MADSAGCKDAKGVLDAPPWIVIGTPAEEMNSDRNSCIETSTLNEPLPKNLTCAVVSLVLAG
jgi:hypothetical protein